MTLHYLLCIAMAGLVLWSTCAFAQTDTVPRLTPEEFPILAWSCTRWCQVPVDVETFHDIRECGFNLAGFVSPDQLDLVSQAGLKAIVLDESTDVSDALASLDEQEIDQRVAAITKRVGQHKALYAYYLRDEPSARLFPGLKRWTEAFRKAAPQVPAYINLFPNYAVADQLNAASYEEYVESYVQTVRPAFLSYDHYALMDDGTLRDGYFQNLEIVRKAALRHNLPFWNIVLSTGCIDYAPATETGLLFQLYTTLAYGAGGISYFTYFTPDVGNFRLGPIDQFGHKTATWNLLRNVNLQMHRIGPTYIKLKSINVFHHPNVPEGCHGIETSQLLEKVQGRDLLVGEFRDPEGEPYVMVVNKDLKRSTSVSLKFKKKGTVRFVSAYSGKMQTWQGENNWLAPGQGMLLCSK